jgi:hypothetical protein
MTSFTLSTNNMKCIKLMFLACLISVYSQLAKANEVRVFDFTPTELESLDKRKLKGETIYTLGSDENGNFLKAETNATGSGLGKEIKINLNETPFINITWKVEQGLGDIDPKQKNMHDFAARVFVAKQMGMTPLSNKAINFAYSNKYQPAEYWVSPWTKSSVDYVLSSSEQVMNEWITVKANVKELYKQLYDLDLADIDGVAIFADTDNTKLSSVSYFRDIYFSSQ